EATLRPTSRTRSSSRFSAKTVSFTAQFKPENSILLKPTFSDSSAPSRSLMSTLSLLRSNRPAARLGCERPRFLGSDGLSNSWIRKVISVAPSVTIRLRNRSEGLMGNFVRHFEIEAYDVDRAKRFYEVVFGWKIFPWGPPDYYLIDTGNAAVTGDIRQSTT